MKILGINYLSESSVALIENGKVKAQGKHQELMESVDTYKSLFLENQTSEI